MKRKVEITIQTEQLVVVRGVRSGREWCLQCECETDMVNLQTVGILTGGDHATAQARIRSGAWDLSAAADGALRVCLAALLSGVGGNLPPRLEPKK